MSSHTNSSLKSTKKAGNIGASSTIQSGSIHMRTSLIPQNSLSKATGVSHLSEKNNGGINGTYLNMQKTLISNSATKKKESKPASNDYYTVQNTRNTSIQNSSQVTSRNNNNLPSQKDNTATATKEQDQSIISKDKNQNKGQSPTRGSANNMGLDQINEKNNSISVAQTDNQKFLMKSVNQIKSGANTTSSRHSVMTEKGSMSRALSQVKSNGILSNFTQATNFNKSQKGKNSLIGSLNQQHPYNENQGGIKQSHKKSIITHQSNQYSPKPLQQQQPQEGGVPKVGIFRSPQQIKKQSTATNLTGAGGSEFISSSNSPLPQQNISNQSHHAQKNQKLNSHLVDTSKTTSVTRQPNNKNLQKSQQSILSINPTMGSNPSNVTSCLQIDLSQISVRNANEDQDNTIQYGATAASNAQTLFQLTQTQTQAKKPSISQNKQTPLNLISSSPNMHALNSFNKSPKTFKNTTVVSNASQQNKHSIVKQTKEPAPKVLESKSQTQKLATSKNQSMASNKDNGTKNQTSTVIKSQSPFDKKYQVEQRLKSQEDFNMDENTEGIFEIKKIIINKKKDNNKSSKQEQDDNISFNSKNNKSFCDPTPDSLQLPSQNKSQQSQNQLLKQESLPVSNSVVSQISLNKKTSIIIDDYVSQQEDDSPTTLIKVVSQRSLQSKQSVSKTAKQIVSLNINDSIDNEGYPMNKIQFLDKFSDQLLIFEIKEIKELKDKNIYFCGNSLKDRQPSYIQRTKNLKAEKEVQKSLDDQEGYYNVLLGDHLMYRYEILKILGKGSFAQVVSCLDHKTNQKVAVKITRNTEIDHKFANSESKLLNFLMQNDPNDSHNVVRLIDEFYFRDHHCFVFELLYTDLFEHLKENSFVGFESDKIRDYAVQILEALVFLEKHEIIHCDLKPENILLRDEKADKLKLVDYGSGCFRDDQVYTYVQSRFYRAPEVILRIPYSEKVDIWSFGCILAELYTGEPLFPGNNEQEQLELIMEICGIPSEKMIDKSRKKDHYFDTDYSPFLIEDEQMGILRIPESKKLEEAVPCQDPLFLDFMRNCLILDPEERFSASQAQKHPWIQESLNKKTEVTIFKRLSNSSLFNNGSEHQALISQPSTQTLQVPNMTRRREEEQDGVKGNVYEASPVRPIAVKEQPKKSLTKHFNFQTVKVGGLNTTYNEEQQQTDSNMSSPKNEAQHNSRPPQEMEMNFQQIIVNKEPINKEKEVNKPHMGNGNSNQQVKGQNMKPKGAKMIGQYEIVRQEEESKQRESNSRTSGIASEANIPPVNQHEAINSENTINKITITFYQKRQVNKK